MACHQMRRCSPSLVIQGTKMKTPVRVPAILTRTAVMIVKEKHPKGWSGREETGTPTAVGSVKWRALVQKTVQQSLRLLDVHFTYDLAVLLLDVYAREIKAYVHTKTCTYVHSSIIQNSPKVETTQMSISQLGNVGQPYSRVFCTPGREDIRKGCPVSDLQNKLVVQLRLYEVSRIGRFIETRGGSVVTEARENSRDE